MGDPHEHLVDTSMGVLRGHRLRWATWPYITFSLCCAFIGRALLSWRGFRVFSIVRFLGLWFYTLLILMLELVDGVTVGNTAC